MATVASDYQHQTRLPLSGRAWSFESSLAELSFLLLLWHFVGSLVLVVYGTAHTITFGGAWQHSVSVMTITTQLIAAACDQLDGRYRLQALLGKMATLVPEPSANCQQVLLPLQSLRIRQQPSKQQPAALSASPDPPSAKTAGLSCPTDPRLHPPQITDRPLHPEPLPLPSAPAAHPPAWASLQSGMPPRMPQRQPRKTS